MSTVTIESAEQKDCASWLPLWINCQTFYRAKVSDEVTKLTWGCFLTPSEPAYYVVAKCNGRIMGLVHYLLYRSAWVESNYCCLEDLSVSEDVHGQYIGKQFIRHVQQQAKKYHASKLYWHTHEVSLRGQRLYDWAVRKSGMIEYQV